MITGARLWGIIYRATNLSNGKVYIGQSVESLCERKSKHLNEARNGKDSYFARALREYGIAGFNWGIIHNIQADDRVVLKRNLNDLEIKEIRAHASMNRDRGYNLTIGGAGSIGFRMSPESREKMRKAKLGVPRSMEARKAVGDGHRGLHHSEESKRKLSESKIGSRNPMFGRAISEDHRRRLSLAQKGRIVSEETRWRQSEGMKRAWARRKAA